MRGLKEGKRMFINIEEFPVNSRLRPNSDNKIVYHFEWNGHKCMFPDYRKQDDEEKLEMAIDFVVCLQYVIGIDCQEEFEKKFKELTSYTLEIMVGEPTGKWQRMGFYERYSDGECDTACEDYYAFLKNDSMKELFDAIKHKFNCDFDYVYFCKSEIFGALATKFTRNGRLLTDDLLTFVFSPKSHFDFTYEEEER